MLSEQLIARLGDDEAAMTALLLAIEAGYDTDQLLDGVRSDDLDAAGVIAGVEPATGPLGRVVGFRSVEPEPLPIERLREGALDAQGFGPAGRGGTLAIMVMLANGYDPETVVDALIFGTDTELRDPEDLSRIEQEQGCLTILDDEAVRSQTDSCYALAARCERVLLIGGEPTPTPGCDAPTSDDPPDGDATTNEPGEGGGADVAVDAATYSVTEVPQAETYGIEVDGGTLTVSADDDELVVTGELIYEKWLWANDTEPFCSSRHTVTVRGSAPLEESMILQLAADTAVDLELLSWGTTPAGDDYCVSGSGWLRDAEFNQAWILDEYPGAFMVVTVDEGALTGCVVYSGDVCPDNLQRVD